jgi:mRNA interferase MazF
MVKLGYIPDVLDIVWLDFEPSKGREMAKVRPAIVISPKYYNERAELILACPITSVSKGYPYEISISIPKVSGVIMADQIRSVSWRERKIRFITKAPPQLLEEVRAMLDTLIGNHGI